ncbi:hypothetical protein ACTWP4_10790 [Gracilibacillus sp. D59]|uniref:hypothetical protein n=1 Tax=Gracilibacillus sp. D59 TaxID=3457434 RepID=UPI003FCCD951
MNIGVIGKTPEVKEQNVNFMNVSLDELELNVNKISTELDAVFIMKEYLEQAGGNQYARVYGELKIPIFFIQSK